MNRGSLIAFEGIDGCGKSTQVAALTQTLQAAGHTVLQTYEPTDGRYGQRIRELSTAGEAIGVEEELRWFIEDRREHVRQMIQPALNAGHIVITDRYYLSTVAYQGARGLDPWVILQNSEEEFPIPDLALILTIDPTDALERIQKRGTALNQAFEQHDFLTRVAGIFKRLEERSYVVSAKGDASAEVVKAQLLAILREKIPTL